jgi:DNA primase
MDSSLIDQAKAVDLLALIGRGVALTRQAATHGGEWAGPCPFCWEGHDRLRVWPNHETGYGQWWCRVCTQGGDAIQYVRLRDRVSFLEAVQTLTGAGLPPARRETLALTPDGEIDLHRPPSDPWQARARLVLGEAMAALWDAQGERARAWLKARGLNDHTLHSAHLGYLPADQREPAEDWGLADKPVYLPRGILIPCEVGGALWYLKVRRPTGKPKYLQARGGRPALYWADSLAGKETAVFCEGEFDTLLLWQAAGDLVGVATLGSAANRLNVGTWGPYLLPIAHRLLAYDQDEAGEKGAGALGWLKGVRNLTVPRLSSADKDLTDYHKKGGQLRSWLIGELVPAMIISPQAVLERHPAYIPGRPIAEQPEEISELWWSMVFAERGISDPIKQEAICKTK